MKITHAEVREIFDSRGRPTIEVSLSSGDKQVFASVPSGKSTGSNEALEKRDADGNGVNDVMGILRDEVFQKVIDQDFSDQRAFDMFLIELDGTKNKARIGANGILAMSIAYAKLCAEDNKKPLWQWISESEGFTTSYPRLYMNVMNGGAHANFRLPFQEYIVVVNETPQKGYEHAQTIFNTLGELIRAEVGEVLLGDEGGYSPAFNTVERPFEILRDLIRVNEGMFLAIDAAATEFAIDGDGYELLEKRYSHGELIELYQELMHRFGLRSIEDPFAENDPGCFIALLEAAPVGTLIIGDDLTVTNPDIVKEMIAIRAINALIVKPNQIGTLTEVYDTVKLAHAAGWQTIVSHRSGETEDSFIADLAVGVGAYGLKAGAPSQKVRTVKYERLIAIEREREG